MAAACGALITLAVGSAADSVRKKNERRMAPGTVPEEVLETPEMLAAPGTGICLCPCPSDTAGIETGGAEIEPEAEP